MSKTMADELVGLPCMKTSGESAAGIDDLKSQHVDPSRMKSEFSTMERLLDAMISRVERLIRHGRENDINQFLIDSHSLRLHMRLVRRWRNGSMVCTTHHLACFSEFILHARLHLIKLDLAVIREQLSYIDQYIFILDDACIKIRDGIEEGVLSIDNVRSLVEHDEGKLSQTEEHIISLQQKAGHLLEEISKLQTHEERDVDCSSIHLTLKNKSANKESFESNPERNSVLILVDEIKMSIRLLKEGYHGRMSDQTKAEVQACADSDVETLRRQLRKIRRWQQNLAHFCSDDVLDLRLILRSIKRHLGKEGRELFCPEPDTQRLRRSLTSYGTMKLVESSIWRGQDTVAEELLESSALATSSIDLSSDSAYASSPSSESDGVVTQNITNTSDNLDETSSFSERLI